MGGRRADAGDLLVARNGAAGVVTDIGSGMDLLVTAAGLAGAEMPADRVARRRRPARAADGNRAEPAHELFYYWDSELRAVRKGAYKAHFITSGATVEGGPRQEHNPPLLFNLAEDPGEHTDVAASHRDVVADLTREAEAHRRGVVPTRPLFDELLPAPRPGGR